MKLRNSLVVLALVCCVSVQSAHAGYALGGVMIGIGVSFFGAGGLLIGLGDRFVQNAGPQYNKTELVVTGYKVDASACQLCPPSGTSGLDQPCYEYFYTLTILNSYAVYVNDTETTESTVTGRYCGNDPYSMREDISKYFPIGSRTPIFYRISKPTEWTYSLSDLNPFRSWSVVPFTAGIIATLGGIIAVAWEKRRRAYGDYQLAPVAS